MRDVTLAIVLGILLGAVGGWQVQAWRWAASDAAAAALVADERKKAAEDAQRVLQEAIDRNTQVEQQRSESLQREQTYAAELDRLNRCLRAGTCGLFVSTVRPATVANPTCGNNAGPARLAPSAEADYLEIERRLGEQYETLKLCQAYAKKPQ